MFAYIIFSELHKSFIETLHYDMLCHIMLCYTKMFGPMLQHFSLNAMTYDAIFDATLWHWTYLHHTITLHEYLYEVHYYTIIDIITLIQWFFIIHPKTYIILDLSYGQSITQSFPVAALSAWFWKYQVLVCWLKDWHKTTCPTCQWHIGSMHKSALFRPKNTSKMCIFIVHALCSSQPKELKKVLWSKKFLIFIGNSIVHFTYAERPQDSIPSCAIWQTFWGCGWNSLAFTNIFNILSTPHQYFQLRLSSQVKYGNCILSLMFNGYIIW